MNEFELNPPLGVFCREHAFYDCPVCRGEEPEWVIPIVEGGEETGEIRVSDKGTVKIAGDSSLTPKNIPPPKHEVKLIFVMPDEPVPEYEPPPNPVYELVRPPLKPVVSQELIDQIERGFSAVEELVKDPRWRDAAARGREIHENALVLSEEEGISYADALRRLTE
jgi:hypothetical protein